MNWLPGWNSPADADWWSNFYFWLGIAFLILLAVSEVASHYYGLRKDVLLDARHRADAERRRHAQQRETERHRAEAEILRHAVLPRALKPHLAFAALKQFSGQSFVIELVDGREPQEIAGKIRETLELAGWKPISSAPLGWHSPISDGITVRFGDSEVIPNADAPSLIEKPLRIGPTRQAATALVGVLTDNRIFVWPGPVPTNNPEPVVLVQVGRKPLPPGLQPEPQSPSSGE